MTKEIRTVVIDRAKWRTGMSSKNATGIGETELLNDEGYMCCLGFICKAHKVGVKNLGTPVDTNRKIPFLTERDIFYVLTDTDLSERAISINDTGDTTRQVKEKKLKTLFKGKLKLVFKGKSVDYQKEVENV